MCVERGVWVWVGGEKWGEGRRGPMPVCLSFCDVWVCMGGWWHARCVVRSREERIVDWLTHSCPFPQVKQKRQLEEGGGKRPRGHMTPEELQVRISVGLCGVSCMHTQL